jgi:hypothetical protein
MSWSIMNPPTVKKRVALAWQVFRHGLPVVRVSYSKGRPFLDSNDALRVEAKIAIKYQGRCLYNNDGNEVWSNNGALTVVAPVSTGFTS